MRRKKQKKEKGQKEEDRWDHNSTWDKHLPNLADKDRDQLMPNNSTSVRIRMGLFYTKKEFEEEVRKVGNLELP